MIRSDKSIEELENDCWKDSDFDSYVVQTCQKARKKPLSQLSDEEVRLLIGQKIGLKYLIPIAISIVSENPLADITFFEGDLLLQLLKLSYGDWKNNKEELKNLQMIVNENIALIKSCKAISDDIIEEFLEIESEKDEDND